VADEVARRRRGTHAVASAFLVACAMERPQSRNERSRSNCRLNPRADPESVCSLTGM
jgi:hypothetical protein